MFEDAISSGNKRANREEQKYACTAGHNDCSHPTSAQEGYYLSRALSNEDDRNKHHDKNDGTVIDNNEEETFLSSSVEVASARSSPTKSPLKKKHRGNNGSLRGCCGRNLLVLDIFGVMRCRFMTTTTSTMTNW